MNQFFSSVILLLSLFYFLLPITKSAARYSYGNSLTGAFLFNPFTYNLIIFVLTGLSGSIGLFFLDRNVDVNTLISTSMPQARYLVPLIMLYGYFVFILFQPSINSLIRRLSDHDLHIKFISRRLAYILVILFLLPIVFAISIRLPTFLSLSSAADSFGVLSLRATLVETESSLYFLTRLLSDELGWLFSLYIIQRRDLRLTSAIFCVVLFLYFVLSLTKSKAILFILSILMVRSWNSRIKFSAIFFKIVPFLFFLLVLAWFFLVKNTELDYLLSPFNTGLIGRIFVSEISSLYSHLSIFGDSVPHIGLSSLSSFLSRTLAIDSLSRSGRIVLETISPSWVDQGFGGVYNTVFFGEAFANFGTVGLILSPLIVCIVYYLIVRASFFLGPRLSIAFLVHTSFNVSMMAGFNDYLWNPFLYVKLGLFLMLSFLVKQRKYIF